MTAVLATFKAKEINSRAFSYKRQQLFQATYWFNKKRLQYSIRQHCGRDNDWTSGVSAHILFLTSGDYNLKWWPQQPNHMIFGQMYRSYPLLKGLWSSMNSIMEPADAAPLSCHLLTKSKLTGLLLPAFLIWSSQKNSSPCCNQEAMSTTNQKPWLFIALITSWDHKLINSLSCKIIREAQEFAAWYKLIIQ